MDYELEYLREKVKNLELELSKKGTDGVDMEDMHRLTKFCERMYDLLLQCRSEQINYTLAKDIDQLIEDLTN